MGFTVNPWMFGRSFCSWCRRWWCRRGWCRSWSFHHFSYPNSLIGNLVSNGFVHISFKSGHKHLIEHFRIKRSWIGVSVKQNTMRRETYEVRAKVEEEVVEPSSTRSLEVVRQNFPSFPFSWVRSSLLD